MVAPLNRSASTLRISCHAEAGCHHNQQAMVVRQLSVVKGHVVHACALLNWIVHGVIVINTDARV